MTPSEKSSLRISWYGLTLGWPLTNDMRGHPYFLAANGNGYQLHVPAAHLNKITEVSVRPGEEARR